MYQVIGIMSGQNKEGKNYKMLHCIDSELKDTTFRSGAHFQGRESFAPIFVDHETEVQGGEIKINSLLRIFKEGEGNFAKVTMILVCGEAGRDKAASK